MRIREFTLFSLIVFVTVVLTGTVGAQAPRLRDGRSVDERGPASTNAPHQQAENVEFIGQIGGEIYAVAVQGDYAYIGVGPRLVILDVSDPARPQVVGQTAPLPGLAYGVAVAGGYAYLADGEAGLRVIDVSNPAAPAEVGFFDTPGDALGVAVAGGYAYVADGGGGLFILRYTGAEPTPGDPYEPDDTCADANAIPANGDSQKHTIHIPGDADWLRFQVTAGTDYIIAALQAGPNAPYAST